MLKNIIKKAKVFDSSMIATILTLQTTLTLNKNRHIICELQEFFANNDAGKAINSSNKQHINTIMNSIRKQSKVIGSLAQPISI